MDRFNRSIGVTLFHKPVATADAGGGFSLVQANGTYGLTASRRASRRGSPGRRS